MKSRSELAHTFRGVAVAGAWIATVACAQRFGDSDWFAVVALVTVFGAWFVGMLDEAAGQSRRRGQNG